jgi:hypothetical protein
VLDERDSPARLGRGAAAALFTGPGPALRFLAGARFLVLRFLAGARFLVLRFLAGARFLVLRFLAGARFLVLRFLAGARLFAGRRAALRRVLALRAELFRVVRLAGMVSPSRVPEPNTANPATSDASVGGSVRCAAWLDSRIRSHRASGWCPGGGSQ